ncbi:MAG: hypothetical protein M1547_03095 [Gammaproteobacteria bacterium]|nr:hypothetical protein [Gammaproteobacteria bacterium]
MSARLLPPAERAARVAQKRAALLGFLRDELYTTATVVGQLLGLNSRQAIHTTLTAMERDELVRRETVTTPAGRRVTLWGITSHGQAFAFDPASEVPQERYFEPGRVGLTVLQHTMDLQTLRLQAEVAGWAGWMLGDRMGKWAKNQSRPDAIVADPQGIKWGIECERTIKTRKRYEAILKDRLLAIKQGTVNKVVWLCPTEEQSNRLKAIIRSIPDTPDLLMLKQGLKPGTLMFGDYQFFKKGKQ